MSLHFLLKAEARSLSVVQVLAMSDDDALTLFRQLRRGEGEQVVCPHCGMAHRHYFRPTRRIWRCAGCVFHANWTLVFHAKLDTQTDSTANWTVGA
jgi:hypothetical protein